MSDELKMIGFDVVMREVEQAREAVLAAREAAGLPALGEYIAWSECERGCTDALSSLHRVGEPKKGQPYTTCGVPIPEPVRWLPLSPAMVNDGLLPCGFCAAFPTGIAQGAA